MLHWSGEASLAALFASAFLSATILPGNSEVVLFAVLREFDTAGVKLIWIETPPETPDWDGVRDRLGRAAAG